MTQLIKSPMQKHKDLNLDPGTHVQGHGMDLELQHWGKVG